MGLLDAVDRAISAPFPEFRDLPPNRLRIRVGVGNRVFFNQPYHLDMGSRYVIQLLAGGYMGLDSHVVDIGCGCGRLAQGLKRAGFSGRYVGIDVDPEHIAWCERHFDESNYRFVHADIYSEVYNPGGSRGAYRVPISDSTVDLVLGHSLFTHLLEEDMWNYICESHRVLKPGGKMFMGVFCREDLADFGLLGGRWTFRHSIKRAYVENQRFPEAAVAYDRDFLLDLCGQAGFSQRSVRPLSSQSVLVAQKPLSDAAGAVQDSAVR